MRKSVPCDAVEYDVLWTSLSASLSKSGSSSIVPMTDGVAVERMDGVRVTVGDRRTVDGDQGRVEGD